MVGFKAATATQRSISHGHLLDIGGVYQVNICIIYAILGGNINFLNRRFRRKRSRKRIGNAHAHDHHHGQQDCQTPLEPRLFCRCHFYKTSIRCFLPEREYVG